MNPKPSKPQPPNPAIPYQNFALALVRCAVVGLLARHRVELHPDMGGPADTGSLTLVRALRARTGGGVLVVCVCMYVSVCICARVCMWGEGEGLSLCVHCMCACVHSCARVCVRTHAHAPIVWLRFHRSSPPPASPECCMTAAALLRAWHSWLLACVGRG